MRTPKELHFLLNVDSNYATKKDDRKVRVEQCLPFQGMLWIWSCKSEQPHQAMMHDVFDWHLEYPKFYLDKCCWVRLHIVSCQEFYSSTIWGQSSHLRTNPQVRGKSILIWGGTKDMKSNVIGESNKADRIFCPSCWNNSKQIWERGTYRQDVTGPNYERHDEEKWCDSSEEGCHELGSWVRGTNESQIVS